MKDLPMSCLVMSFNIQGDGNSFQYSCLANPMDRGAWQATVHGVTKSHTGLKRFSMHAEDTLHV